MNQGDNGVAETPIVSNGLKIQVILPSPFNMTEVKVNRTPVCSVQPFTFNHKKK